MPADHPLDYAAHIRPMVRTPVEQAGLRELLRAANRCAGRFLRRAA